MGSTATVQPGSLSGPDRRLSSGPSAPPRHMRQLLIDTHTHQQRRQLTEAQPAPAGRTQGSAGEHQPALLQSSAYGAAVNASRPAMNASSQRPLFAIE